ncbi:MAG: hypothetical protein IK103_02830 [Bacteroidales bacterium]|nr:hypothetical protein [Bacteroidales bacterium]
MKTIKTIPMAFCLILFSAIFFGCKNAGQSQTKAADAVAEVQVPDHYSVPQELVYAEPETYQVDDQTFPLYLFDKFYPIGWSKDGKLAYMEEPADEAVGAYFFQFHILDLNTGKDVFTWKPEEDPEEGSLSQMFELNKELFEGKLKENSIIPQEFKLEEANVKMDKTMAENPFIGSDVVKNVKITSGETVIYENLNNDEYNVNLDQNIAGVLKCPYSDMEAVMVKSILRGYEGPPHVYTFYFVKAGK